MNTYCFSSSLFVLHTLLFLLVPFRPQCIFFFFNDTATTEIYTLSLHDALPISRFTQEMVDALLGDLSHVQAGALVSSEEHTSELQSRPHLVCRLLLEKKK